MAIRTIRLDGDTEQDLREIVSATGMPVAAAIKRGLRSVRDEVIPATRRRAYDIYTELDLGAGGDANGPSSDSRGAAKRAIAARRGR